MRKFFIFCLFVVCFLVAGFSKGDLASTKFDGVKDYKLDTYINEQNSTLVYGQTISSKADSFNICEFLNSLNASKVRNSIICDRNIIYAYSNKLSRYVYVDGAKVNLQISINEDNVVVGYPLIIGSF